MLTLVIQAGGESRRMGRDKALVPFLGQPLIQRVLTRLAGIADEVIVTTNRPQDYAFLGLPLHADIYPQRGALGGLHTALANAHHPLVAVVACDMPFASPKLLAWQASLLLADNTDVAIPLQPGGYEPLHTVYRRETCLPAIEWALQNDQWKLISWFPRVKLREITTTECTQCDPASRIFSNVNTPEELAEAEELARRED